MARVPLKTVIIAAGLVLSAVEARAATAVQQPMDLSKAARALHEEIQVEILARRAEMIGEKVDAFALDLINVRLDAVKLKRRAETAARRNDRDPFFAFDLGKFKDDVWRRALWMRERRWDAEKLEREIVPAEKLAKRLAGALAIAGRAAKQVADLDTACFELQETASQVDRSLIGSGAAWDTATARASSAEILAQLSLVELSLERSLKDATQR